MWLSPVRSLVWVALGNLWVSGVYAIRVNSLGYFLYEPGSAYTVHPTLLAAQLVAAEHARRH